MGADLQSCQLGDICQFSGGAGFAPKYQGATSGEYPFIKVSDMELPGNEFRILTANNWIDEPTRRLLKAKAHPANATVFAKIGIALTYNRRRLLTRPTAIDNNMMAAIPDESRVDPRFFYYLLKQTDFNTVVGGTALPYINASDLAKMEVQLPPLPEQKAIARILGTLDDKIELNRRMNATLEAMARALFQSWFVDFDPVHAKAAGRQPSDMAEKTAALFPATFQDSELGKIPDGWRVGSIYEAADVIYGAPFSSKQFNEDGDGKPLIRIRDLADESPGVCTPEVHPKGHMVQPGDVVVGMDGEFRAYLWGGVPAWLNQRVCVFAPKPAYSAAFVRNSIIAPLAHVEATETATTVIHLGKNDIDRFKVIIPSPEIHAAFAKLCQPWYDRIVANKQQTRTLATLRDTLLPQLLSGEIGAGRPQPTGAA